MDIPEYLSKLSEPQLYLEQHENKCVILDKIQRMPSLFPILRGLVDKKRIQGRFIILGSASPGLIKDSSETLAGRIVYKELTTFNLTEIIDKYNMLLHWFRGGFPEAFLSPNEELSHIWLRNFIQAYIERDLPLLGFSASPIVIRKFWTMLAHFHGNIWNANQFAGALGVTIPTLNRYLDFLESVFIINRLQPFYLNLKKRLVKSPKIYIRDSGILHYLIGMTDFEQLQGNVLFGHSWESYAVEQIKQITNGKVDLYFYRTLLI